jgi:predicted short-subunit dehydrogenase-like oxidoreductase (DUF2520 family)
VTPAGVAVIGGGRVGLSLARALAASGTAVTVLGRRDRDLPPPLGAVARDWRSALDAAGIVLLAVPDDAIPAVASAVADTAAITARHVVLHTAGGRDRAALAALEPSGAALGSFHPLQTFRDPTGDPEVLRRAPAVLEGDPRAIEMGRGLAGSLGMSPVLVVPSAGKASYHAAAVLASNAVVVLVEHAARLARAAGLDATAALFAPLIAETAAGLASAAPASVLTGPIRRGDVETVVAHLAALEGEVRELYRLLGLGAVALAVQEGMAPEKAARLRAALA